MLMDDLDSMGPVKLSAVEEAQSAVVEVALALQRDGKITIAGAGGEEMV
jgi:flagellar motor switch protein FliG